jgi:hypothetical protein
MKGSTFYAWTAIGGLAVLSIAVFPLASYYFLFDVNVYVVKFYTIDMIPKEEIFAIDDSTLKVYSNIKEAIEKEEVASQKCASSAQDSCIFTVSRGVAQFKVPEIDQLSQTFHLKDSSSPVLGTQLCGTIGYSGNYYSLEASIPTDELFASILHGGLATVIGTVVIAFLWVKYGGNGLMKRSGYHQHA